MGARLIKIRMGIGAALEEVLLSFKPRTLGAVIVILFTLIGGTLGVFGTLGAQAWWITTRGRAYTESEAARWGMAMDRIEKAERRLSYLEEDRNLDRRTAERVTRIEGMVEGIRDMLTDRRRGR